MSFYKAEKCSCCGSKKYPLNHWQNWLKVDWLMLAIIISVILIIFGAKETVKDCKEFMTDPCPRLSAVCCVSGGVNDGLQYQGSLSNGVIGEDSKKSG